MALLPVHLDRYPDQRSKTPHASLIPSLLSHKAPKTGLPNTITSTSSLTEVVRDEGHDTGKEHDHNEDRHNDRDEGQNLTYDMLQRGFGD